MAQVDSGTEPKTRRSPSRRRDRPGPRQRLLASATLLFTTEGIRVIGIDRILRQADVAKASLYSLFGSKDKLVVAYLEELDRQWRDGWHLRTAEMAAPGQKVLAFFDQCIAEEPAKNFRGSHFQNAASEYPRPETDTELEIRAAALAHRRWCLEQLCALFDELGQPDPAGQADRVLVLLEGGINGSKMTGDLGPLHTARAMAQDLLG